jgi:ribosomal protein L11 methyltransferase
MTDIDSGSLDGGYRQTKLVLELADRDFARTIAGALQDLVDPAPHALTLFEQGPGAWRI